MQFNRKIVTLISVIIVTSFILGTAVLAVTPENTGLDALWDALLGIEQEMDDLQTEVDIHAEVEYLRGIVEALQAQVNSFPNWPCLQGPRGDPGPEGPTGPSGPQGPAGLIHSIPNASAYSNTYSTVDVLSMDPVPIPDLHVTMTLEEDGHVVILGTVEYCSSTTSIATTFSALIEQGEETIPAAPDAYSFFGPSLPRSDTASFHFFIENLPAGTYDIELQVGSLDIGGAIIEFRHRALTVFAIPT